VKVVASKVTAAKAPTVTPLAVRATRATKVTEAVVAKTTRTNNNAEKKKELETIEPQPLKKNEEFSSENRINNEIAVVSPGNTSAIAPFMNEVMKKLQEVNILTTAIFNDV
jgi:hypothetical protein